MKLQANEIRYFLYSQAFADGFRTTISIMLPVLVLSYFNQFGLGLLVGLGALCTNFADAPGPVVHKRNGMLFCTLFIFLVTWLTAYAQRNTYTMGIEIVLICFLFSMFTVYGDRATSVGNAAILVMILQMDKPVPPGQELLTSVWVLAGGIWYMLISLLFYNIWPYRLPQRVLGECLREIATYLSIKADFYDTSTDLDANYRNLIAQQIVINDKQNALREILFKTRQIVKETTTTGRRLVLTFIDTVDLFEDITAIYYDYTALRSRFGGSGLLDEIAAIIRDMAHELDKMGLAMQAKEKYRRDEALEQELKTLKDKIDSLGQEQEGSSLVLKKILVNLRTLLYRFQDIADYFYGDRKRSEVAIDHSRFISHQALDPGIIWINLTMQSSVFKHALRVSLACITGYSIAKLISYGHHSYWILMTIAFMLKPAFSLTKQRNIQRIQGTVIGGIAGIIILLTVTNRYVLFGFMAVFMLGTYSFQRIKYLAMVICTTPYILILFKFLGIGFLKLAEERILDTAIGCTIAFLAGYFLFPQWESGQLENYMLRMLEANRNYLNKVILSLTGRQVTTVDYKLARKDVYVSSANLSAAFQRMLSEPKSKQLDSSKVHQFVVLNHILFSNVATVATSLVKQGPTLHLQELLRPALRACEVLRASIEKLSQPNKETVSQGAKRPEVHKGVSYTLNVDEQLLKDQMEFILKLAVDIQKTLDHLTVA